MSYNKPLPRIDTLNKPFWDGAKQKKLLLQHCPTCGDTRFPPGPVCPKCLAGDQTWIESAGTGTLESWVDMHRAYWDGFKDSLPYRVCLVRLTEGPVIASNLVGSNLVGSTGNLKMGMNVKVVFEDVTEDITLPKFTIAET